MMDDLLNAMLGGAGSGPDQAQDSSDPLSELLGAAMGDGDAGSAGGLLGALLSGGGAQGAGGLGDILGSVLGGGGAATQAGGLIDPIAASLTEKLGLPPEVSRAVVAFAFSKLVAALTGAASESVPAAGSAQAPGDGLDLDHLLGQMGSGQGLDATYLKSTGMADELAEQTGLDRDTAAASLQETFSLLGGQMAGGEPSVGQAKPKKNDLGDLLATW